VRGVLEREVDLRAAGPTFVTTEEEPEVTRNYRRKLNSRGSPSETLTSGDAARSDIEQR
jgi:hypothetical protein